MSQNGKCPKVSVLIALYLSIQDAVFMHVYIVAIVATLSVLLLLAIATFNGSLSINEHTMNHK